MRIAVLTLISVAIATPALAVEGVLEINQTCAVETGCLPGDAAGWPVTISESGSYRLTSNLIVPDENTDGIAFPGATVSFVSIDLAGFEIRGPVRCSGLPLVCTPATGTGSGISGTSSANRGISVTNGSISGMGSYGVRLGDQAVVSNLRLTWNRLDGLLLRIGSTSTAINTHQNGGDGIATGVGSTLSEITAHRNGQDGIDVDQGATISNATLYSNGGNGLSAGTGGTVSACTAYSNGGDGLRVSNGATVSGSTSYLNALDGISVGSGSILSENTSYENGLDGIAASFGSTIRGNTIRGNDAWGIDLSSSTSAYRENTVSTSGATFLGTVSGGLNAGGNVCNGSLTCP